MTSISFNVISDMGWLRGRISAIDLCLSLSPERVNIDWLTAGNELYARDILHLTLAGLVEAVEDCKVFSLIVSVTAFLLLSPVGYVVLVDGPALSWQEEQSQLRMQPSSSVAGHSLKSDFKCVHIFTEADY